MFDFKSRRSLQRIAWIDQPAIRMLSDVFFVCATTAENFRPSTSLLDHASRQRSAKLQAQMPKAFTGALLAELRPSPVIPVTFVAPTANSARYGCRLPSASATLIVSNDGRYQYRCCRSRFFTGVNEPFTIAISVFFRGSYPLLLRDAFCS